MQTTVLKNYCIENAETREKKFIIVKPQAGEAISKNIFHQEEGKNKSEKKNQVKLQTKGNLIKGQSNKRSFHKHQVCEAC